METDIRRVLSKPALMKFTVQAFTSYFLSKVLPIACVLEFLLPTCPVLDCQDSLRLVGGADGAGDGEKPNCATRDFCRGYCFGWNHREFDSTLSDQ